MLHEILSLQYKPYQNVRFLFEPRAASCRGKKGQISMRNLVLGFILAILGRNIVLLAPRTSNSGMENPILRTEFLFYVDLYVNQRSKN
jgi:hypothetical protein